MNCSRSLAFFGMLAMLPALPPGPGPALAARLTVGSITGLTEPSVRQVVQRRDDNIGSILFIGTYTGLVEGFQVRSTLRNGMQGIAQNWTPLIDVTIFQGYFVGIFHQPAGGFYDLQIRPVFQGMVGAPFSVAMVGVGEVFITAGQSNATNYGSPTGFFPDTRVSSFVDGFGRGVDPSYPSSSWTWGYDPQPSVDLSSGGSPWPTMANNLVNALDVPIGLYAAGCGGTAIGEWMPGYLRQANRITPRMVLFNRLTNAISYFNARGGFRAVLWNQGESDYDLQSNPAVYQANLNQIINQSRGSTGIRVKWMVARASSPLVDNITLRAGLEQAQGSVVDYILTFPGPNTDLIGLPYRNLEAGGTAHHLNAPGLVLLGGYWGIYVANMPGFLYPGELRPY